MERTIDTEQYEKDFLIRFVKKKTEGRILKLQIKINKYIEDGKDDKVDELEARIAKLRCDLETNLISLRNVAKKEAKGGPRIIIKTDVSIKVVNDNDDMQFEKNRNSIVHEYCSKHSIDYKNFNTHLSENVNKYCDVRIFSPIFAKLFTFQKDGISWLYGIYKQNVGGILADEMGLGKTLQIIGYISALILQECVQRVLILCPATIIDHWASEWKLNFPYARILIYHRERTSNIETFYLKCNSAVVLMSYESFKLNFNNCNKVDWDYVVLDEGHKIKNRKSHISGFVKLIPTRNKIVVTGTPMQNNLSELWNILDFVNPKLLGDYEVFKAHFEEPIKKGGYVNASKDDIELSEELARHLNSIITPFILRRTKKEVATQLPGKIEKVVFCDLTGQQSKLYEETINSETVFSILQGKKNALCGIDMLRKICNHPYLLSRKPELLEKHKLESCSGKLIRLNRMLHGWVVDGKKVLIFTQTIEMSNILARNFDYQKFKYLRMDGRTKLQTRAALVNTFNNDPSIFVFLLTTRVGGLGLNLVGASRVIIYDPDWNPAVDIQAKERVYRYGQVDSVEIYKFITHDTVEEKILNTQIFKTILEKKIFSNAQLSNFINKLDLDIIFSYRTSTNKRGNIKESIVDKEYTVMTQAPIESAVTALEIIDYIRKREANFK